RGYDSPPHILRRSLKPIATSTRQPRPQTDCAPHLSQPMHLRVRLLQPEAHLHLTIHRDCGGQERAGVITLADPPIEPAEAQIAVRDEGAHAARLGECQPLAVMGLALLGIETLGPCRDVAEQMPRMGQESWLVLRGLSRTLAQPLRLVEQAEQQSGT